LPRLRIDAAAVLRTIDRGLTHYTAAGARPARELLHTSRPWAKPAAARPAHRRRWAAAVICRWPRAKKLLGTLRTIHRTGSRTC